MVNGAGKRVFYVELSAKSKMTARGLKMVDRVGKGYLCYVELFAKSKMTARVPHNG